MAAAAEFVEWAEVYGQFYGTSVRQLRRAQRAGEDILLDIDVQGHRQIRRRLPESVGVFLIPPSYQELRRRLVNRRSDSPEAIRNRLAAAREEIGHWREYDYVLVNEDVGRTAKALRTIIAASCSRSGSQRNLIENIVKSFGG
jgi:guanylate kinase